MNRYCVWFMASMGWMAPAVLFAQEYARQYKIASDFFHSKKYNLAMEAFKPLMVYDRENPYVEYASFYYAVSAHHQKFPEVAKDMFLQIKSLYPKWNRLAEVNYWLAKIYFDQQQYFQAMRVLKEVPANALKKNRDLMKWHYLSQIDDVETQRMMWEEHPDDSVVGKALALLISKQPFEKQDRVLLESLILRFHLDKDEFANAAAPASVFKDKYTVALLFPFLANTLEPTPGVKVNQSVLDLYLGMRMALDTLESQGIHIDLRAYDTERSAATMGRILGMEELRSVDLIVGPLFQDQLKLVQEFSVRNKINMVNPVSGNADYIQENPFALLYQPGYETVGMRSAEWIAENIANKNCMVFFGETPKDSVTAYGFLRRAKELDLNIVWAEEVMKDKSVDIFNKLATPVEYDEFKNPIEFTLKRDSIGSVFVASDDPLIYTKAISGVDTRADSTVIVGSETWLNNTAADFETYERLRITMAAPNFVSPSNSNFIAFRKQFLKRHGMLPSEFSKLGYEFLWFVGKSLFTYGVYFQTGLSTREFIPGYMFKGCNFKDSRSNQHVPFVTFKGGELTLTN